MSFVILNENNKVVNTKAYEFHEQQLADEFIEADDCVLELGARYGSVSCIINSKLKCKTDQVSVEPDVRVWDCLETNKFANKCEFHILKGFISKQALTLKQDMHYGGYATYSTPAPPEIVQNESMKNYSVAMPKSMTLDEVPKEFPLTKPFNVLVADCEGFLETFLDENPTFLESLRMIIYETDRPQFCDYKKIATNLKSLHFVCVKTLGQQMVWKRTN